MTSAASTAAGRQLTADLAAEPDVTVLASYWTTPVPQLKSVDGRSGLILAVIAGDQGQMVTRGAELYHSGSDLEASVTTGLARTGRIVTSAALLLAVSFFAFVFSTVSMLQLFGLGAALAVIIDATLVRGVLVPAAMRMLGRSNFWAPPFLRRVHAKVGLAEG